jgi:hypothetical protein
MAPQGFCKPSFDHVSAGRKGGLKGGPSGGRNNVTVSRHAKLGIFAVGVQSSAARLMLHQRWHVKRKRTSPSCWLCKGGI